MRRGSHLKQFYWKAKCSNREEEEEKKKNSLETSPPGVFTIKENYIFQESSYYFI